MLRRLLALAVFAALALPAAAQARRPGARGPAGPGGPGPERQPGIATGANAEITGYITDSHCGLKGANKTHTAQCIETCMKGGSRPQILNQDDHQLYTLDSLAKVKDLVGVRVTLKGALSSDGARFTVASAEKAAAPELP